MQTQVPHRSTHLWRQQLVHLVQNQHPRPAAQIQEEALSAAQVPDCSACVGAIHASTTRPSGIAQRSAGRACRPAGSRLQARSKGQQRQRNTGREVSSALVGLQGAVARQLRQPAGRAHHHERLEHLWRESRPARLDMLSGSAAARQAWPGRAHNSNGFSELQEAGGGREQPSSGVTAPACVAAGPHGSRVQLHSIASRPSKWYNSPAAPAHLEGIALPPDVGATDGLLHAPPRRVGQQALRTRVGVG